MQLLRTGCELAQRAYAAAQLADDEPGRRRAVAFVDYLLERYVQPDGVFMEYDRNTWLQPHEMWRTIPWGVAFHGNRLLDCYQQMKPDLSPADQRRWAQRLCRTGTWIHNNPVVGTIVWNCGIELCRLLWRLGSEFAEPSWTEWSLTSAHELLSRHLDPQGWITGENGGVSGSYQLIGAEFLGAFALESRDPSLVAAVHRIADLHLQFSTPTLTYLGNFGTRSPRAGKLMPGLLFAAADLGHAGAAAAVRGWERPSSSIPAAEGRIAVAPRPVTLEPVASYPGIAAHVAREGPWQVWFFNYDRSLWSRGWSGLWHENGDCLLFATGHSLPTTVEAAKLRLSESNDWAGFPHVRVSSKTQRYDTQQRIDGLEMDKGRGVTVTWTEPLLSPQGETGGRMRSRLLLEGPVLTLETTLSELAGDTILDFHLQRAADRFYALWAGDEVTAIEEGVLPRSGGSFRDRVFDTNPPTRYAVQIDRRIYAFEFRNLPAGAEVILMAAAESGLHTGDLGGVRLRVKLPPGLSCAELVLSFQLLQAPAEVTAHAR